MLKIRIAFITFLSILGAALAAAPATFLLDQDNSVVGFTYSFGGQPTNGTMPVESAQLSIDLDNVAASEVAVILRADQARAGFAFATQVMKGEKVLDTPNHPTLSFQSTRIRGDLNGAKITGNLTIRGVTREVTMDGQLFRQRGTEAGERNALSILLTTQINRQDFGADGWQSYVGDLIDIRILARINRAN
jgi:polyisoprenoid-binding protein YceI